MIKSVRFSWQTCFLFCLGFAAAGPFALRVQAAETTVPDSATVAADPNVQKVVAANTDFGFRLLHALARSQKTENIFFSPFSISNALSMTLNGAGGQTRQEMAQTLGLGKTPLADINAGNTLLLPSLENPDPKVDVSLANALWVREGLHFAPDFQKRVETAYGARTTVLDLSSPFAAGTINGWVKQQTHEKINGLVSSESLAKADVVLTNAIYFHGQWLLKFPQDATQDAPFTEEGGKSKTVPMMSQEFFFSYLETPQFQAVSLPYGMNRLSLYVFLPKTGTDLNTFLGTLTADDWTQWIGQMQPTHIRIFLPRFSADYDVTLKDPLMTLGMRQAFGTGADFAPMGPRGLFISEVIHKTIIEVDEEGTIAASATGVMMTRGPAQPPSAVMRVDHPFFCAIRDNATGTLLFAGVIRDPK